MTKSEYIDDVRHRVANNIRYYRHQRGMSQSEFAEFCGVAENTVYLLENPHKAYNVSLVTLAGVTHALSMNVMSMFCARAPQPNVHGANGRAYLQEKRARYEQDWH